MGQPGCDTTRIRTDRSPLAYARSGLDPQSTLMPASSSLLRRRMILLPSCFLPSCLNAHNRLLPLPPTVHHRPFADGGAAYLCHHRQTIPEQRQTLLFSATLPAQLAQFARAGLREPTLIRLDVDTKVSEQLSLAFFTVRAADKNAALLYLLREVRGRGRGGGG
jgi:hypothetical protein